MALNMCEMWFNGNKIAFFPKKLQKIAQQLGASPPDPQSLQPLGAQTCDMFELHWLSQNVSKVTYLHFSTISLSPLPQQNLGKVPTGKF